MNLYTHIKNRNSKVVLIFQEYSLYDDKEIFPLFDEKLIQTLHDLWNAKDIFEKAIITIPSKINHYHKEFLNNISKNLFTNKIEFEYSYWYSFNTIIEEEVEANAYYLLNKLTKELSSEYSSDLLFVSDYPFEYLRNINSQINEILSRKIYRFSEINNLTMQPILKNKIVQLSTVSQHSKIISEYSINLSNLYVAEQWFNLDFYLELDELVNYRTHVETKLDKLLSFFSQIKTKHLLDQELIQTTSQLKSNILETINSQDIGFHKTTKFKLSFNYTHPQYNDFIIDSIILNIDDYFNPIERIALSYFLQKKVDFIPFCIDTTNYLSYNLIAFYANEESRSKLRNLSKKDDTLIYNYIKAKIKI